MSVAEKFRKAREQRLHEQFQQPKPLALARPVVGEKSGFDRNRVNAFTDPNDIRVILMTESRWQKILLQRRESRDRQEVNAIRWGVAR